MVDLKSAELAVRSFQELLDKTPLTAGQIRIADTAWTLGEIVGHLIDSASNNHQRFVRLRFGDLEKFPVYTAEPWVEVQKYAECDFKMLMNLWTSYNELLLHLTRIVPEDVLENEWITAKGERLSLGFLVDDYYGHIRLHTKHYAERLDEVLVWQKS